MANDQGESLAPCAEAGSIGTAAASERTKLSPRAIVQTYNFRATNLSFAPGAFFAGSGHSVYGEVEPLRDERPRNGLKQSACHGKDDLWLRDWMAQETDVALEDASPGRDLRSRRFHMLAHLLMIARFRCPRPHLTKGRATFSIPVIVLTTAWLSVPTKADDRPSDPFGNHTAELNEDVPIVKMWDLLRYKMVIEKDYFRKCQDTKGDCPSIPELVQKLDEVRHYQGKALLGHLNMSINLMIKPAPANWTTPLEAITMRHGDCKSYSMAKYAGAQELGIPADHVRLVIVHIPRRSEDHMITAVYLEGEWFLLDNLTNFLVTDSERTDYEPLAVLDYKGARRYLSAFWLD